MLFERLYGADARASDKVIEVLMSGLRGKLAAAGWDRQIENRRGFGYVLGLSTGAAGGIRCAAPWGCAWA